MKTIMLSLVVVGGAVPFVTKLASDSGFLLFTWIAVVLLLQVGYFITTLRN